MKNIELITLRSSEWQQFKEIRLKALKDSPSSFGSTYEKSLQKTEAEWKKILEDLKLYLLFAKKSVNIIGLGGVFFMNEKAAHILWLFVQKEHRGQGIASALMDELISQVRKNKNIKTIELQVNPLQKAAVKLYERSGFKKVAQND